MTSSDWFLSFWLTDPGWALLRWHALRLLGDRPCEEQRAWGCAADTPFSLSWSSQTWGHHLLGGSTRRHHSTLGHLPQLNKIEEKSVIERYLRGRGSGGEGRKGSVSLTVNKKERERERDRDRHRQTDRDRQRQREREKERQRHRERGREGDRKRKLSTLLLKG